MRVLRSVLFVLIQGFGSLLGAQNAVWPLSGSSTPDTIAAQFGPRNLNGAYDYHRGLDFRKPSGSPIYAPMAGTVVRVRPYVATGQDSTTSLRRFGNFLVIAHDDVLVNGVLTKNQTVYQHLASFSVVLGQQIAQGQQIGTVGMSGENINTEHLHFEWYHNKNNGDINRENTRNPLELFSLPTRKVASMLFRKPDSLQVYVKSSNGYFGLKTLLVKLDNDTLKHIDFEKRISINAANEDVNPYQGLWIQPESFTHGTQEYGIQFTFPAMYNASSDIAVKAIGVQGYEVEALFENEKKYTLLSGKAGWRLLSIPSTTYSVNDFSALSPVQGVTGSPWPAATSNFYFYSTLGSFSVPSSMQTLIPAGSASVVYFFDNDQSGSSRLPILLHTAAPEPENTVEIPLYSGAAGRFTLLGNPFSTSINASQLVGVGGSIQATVHLWDNETQSYKSKSRVANGGLIIEPWQGFWVETSDASITAVQIPTSAKTDALGENYLYKTIENACQIGFEIQRQDAVLAHAAVVFEKEASLGRDFYDASIPPTLESPLARLVLRNDVESATAERVIESLPLSLSHTHTIPLMLEWNTRFSDGTFQWTGNLPTGFEAFLRDEQNRISIQIYPFGSIALGKLAQMVNAEKGANTSKINLFVDIVPAITSGNETDAGLPKVPQLRQNYPNPFNPETVIQFDLPTSVSTRLRVFDIFGRKVAEPVNGIVNAGSHRVLFNATGLASGTYIYQLTAGGTTLTRKMVVLK